MRILGIETSGDHSSVALVEDGRVIVERLFPSRMSLCQTLAGHVEAVMGELPDRIVWPTNGGLPPRPPSLRGRGELPGPPPQPEACDYARLDVIAVSLGPGSFTGLRVGVAMAKAIAHATSLPLVGIPTHEALAWAVSLGCDSSICVIQHARKTDVYTTTFGCSEDGELTEVARCQVLGIGDLLARLREEGTPVIIVGDGRERYREEIVEGLGDVGRIAPPGLSSPRAGSVAALAAARMPHADSEAAFGLRPIYVLASQAERQQGVDLGLAEPTQGGHDECLSPSS